MLTDLETIAKSVRKRIFQFKTKAKAGHLASCLSCVDIAVSLYRDAPLAARHGKYPPARGGETAGNTGVHVLGLYRNLHRRLGGRGAGQVPAPVLPRRGQGWTGDRAGATVSRSMGPEDSDGRRPLGRGDPHPAGRAGSDLPAVNPRIRFIDDP